MEVTRDGREIVFIWVPSHVSISLVRGNLAAEAAAKPKDALDGNITDELISFSDLKSCVKYLLELWQSEWSESECNKLHKIFPKLNCISCAQINREETVNSFITVGCFSGAADLLPLSPDFLFEA